MAECPRQRPAQCPRCGGGDLEWLADSPAPGVWRVWACSACGYSWRTSEPPANRSRAEYPESFRLTERDLDAAPDVPPVPERE